MNDKRFKDLSRRELLLKSTTVAWVAGIPALLAACGQKAAQGGATGNGGQTPAPASADGKSGSQEGNKKGSGNTANKKSGGRRSTEDGDSLGGKAKGVSSPAEVKNNEDAEASGQGQQPEAPAKAEAVAGLRGAKPEGGFFNSGAPELTLEQIQAGQPINGQCEGGLHQLVIEPEHLAALARGETVTVKSSRHTHLGNPTVHDHGVTYRPIMA